MKETVYLRGGPLDGEDAEIEHDGTGVVLPMQSNIHALFVPLVYGRDDVRSKELNYKGVQENFVRYAPRGWKIMGHYDSSREGYCAKCGAAPGNIKNGKCEFCDLDVKLNPAAAWPFPKGHKSDMSKAHVNISHEAAKRLVKLSQGEELQFIYNSLAKIRRMDGFERIPQRFKDSLEDLQNWLTVEMEEN